VHLKAIVGLLLEGFIWVDSSLVQDAARSVQTSGCLFAGCIADTKLCIPLCFKDSHLLTARWKYSDTVAAEPFKLIVFLLLTAVAAMVAPGVGKV
jgi:hypothetical protein